MPGHLIRRMNQLSTALFRERMSASGLDLTPVQFAVMSVLDEAGETDQAKLAARVAYDKVTIGGVVDRLVAKGMVDRRPSRTDRRAKALRLTQNGIVLLDRARPTVRDMQDELLARLSPDEAATLSALLAKATGASETRLP
ncbi:MarR family transcriptional regulator [Maritimibacter sp. DP1N21-5]|nr:MarR family transcriptional regulator [Maritimibacter sp. DP1N21-5]